MRSLAAVLKAAFPVSPRGSGRLRLALLLSVAAVALLALSRRAAPLQPAAASPTSTVLVSNAHYLTRGNVGHWGYALFGLHAALAGAPSGSRPLQLTLCFDARVSAGDWVRTMTAALSRRHGVEVTLAQRRADGCRLARGAAGAVLFARLDANDARTLSTGREDALREAWLEVCHTAVHRGPPAADVLIYNRNARSSRRLCNTAAVVAAVEARGLSVAYTEVPASACEQVAALSQPLRFLITPHGAHEVNLFATWPNATVIEVMPRWTDIPIYNRLVERPVYVISERLENPYPCTGGSCAPLPPHYGACTRNTFCRKFARNRPCVRANLDALARVLDGA